MNFDPNEYGIGHTSPERLPPSTPIPPRATSSPRKKLEQIGMELGALASRMNRTHPETSRFLNSARGRILTVAKDLP